MADFAFLRPATADDAEAVQAIYAPYVTDSTISFETEAPTPEEMRARIEATKLHHPWIVLEAGDDIIGYAYGTEHRTRAAYRWACDTSVYLHPDARGNGYGKRLYQTLLELLTAQGFYNAYGGITLPNDASVALHESCGFRQCATYTNVGWKNGAWRDVGWWSKPLALPTQQPNEPLSMGELQRRSEWTTLLTTEFS